MYVVKYGLTYVNNAVLFGLFICVCNIAGYLKNIETLL